MLKFILAKTDESAPQPVERKKRMKHRGKKR